MKFRLGACAAVVLLAACSGQESGSEMAALRGSAGGDSLKSQARAAMKPSGRDVRHSIASAPDRGALMAYQNQGKPAKREGAFTYYPVSMSEDHALKGVVTGHMTVPMPDGSEVKLNYERHDEGIDGNWTWVGRVEGGDPMQEAIITFGEEAVFASIPQGNGKPPLSIRTRGTELYAVQMDPAKVRSPNVGHTDMAIPGASALIDAATNQAMAAQAQVAQNAVAMAAPPSSSNTVDVAVGYTAGFRNQAALSQQSVSTVLTFLFQVANQGLSNSKVNGYLRLVNAQEVPYTDNNTNQTALHELTGSNGSSNVTVPAALTPLRTARDTYGADVALLIRGFQQPEHQGCGIAWLIGADGATVNPAADAKWGYGVVSFGDDLGTDGNSYYCAPESMVHEVGHLLGSAHDQANSNGTVGRYPYSYGYKSTIGNFYTIMAYGDVGQTPYRLFSNPSIATCGGNSCGIVNTADNARSLNQTIPVVAQFRATVIGFEGFPKLEVIKKNGSAGTEVHTLNGYSKFQDYSRHIATLLGPLGNNAGWAFQFADYNRDGTLDLYAIKKVGASGKTEVHVLNGANGFRSFLLNTATALANAGTDSRWEFGVADYNRDGQPDLYLIDKSGSSGRTEIHVLNASGGFKNYLLHSASALPAAGNNDGWKFEFGHYNSDNVLDLYVIKKVGGSGRTEVHVLNGNGGFKSFLLQKATILPTTGTDNSWDFKLGDYDQNGVLDLFAIKKSGSSGRTEVHVLNGSNQFQSFLLQAATGLASTGNDHSWEFVVTK